MMKKYWSRGRDRAGKSPMSIKEEPRPTYLANFMNFRVKDLSDLTLHQEITIIDLRIKIKEKIFFLYLFVYKNNVAIG